MGASTCVRRPGFTPFCTSRRSRFTASLHPFARLCAPQRTRMNAVYPSNTMHAGRLPSPRHPPTGADQAGRQPRAGGQVVQGRPEDHRVSDSHRCHAGVPRGALHAAVCGIDVSGHGSCPSAGATLSGPYLGVDVGCSLSKSDSPPRKGPCSTHQPPLCVDSWCIFSVSTMLL